MKSENFNLRCLALIVFPILACMVASAQTIETGTVKEYRGVEQKLPLAGVELMVKGAPSTLSDDSGNFNLRFTTLAPGAKVEYTEIYKDGFVIFNRDALEAWRISNNGKPFTIVMCRESDFRKLKKKFYGIIEKSYLDEYNRQKALTEQHARNEDELRAQLKLLEADYNEKMGNINTYVDLFSRIDLSEISDVEAKVVEHLERSEIDQAIELFESLNLQREVDGQLSKLNAAEQMHTAANIMEDEAINDLIVLVEKLRRQLGLYEMGGEAYNYKSRSLIDNLISLMGRLNSLSNNSYNEELGALYVKRAKMLQWGNREADFRAAAALPSSIGLFALADRLEQLDHTSMAHTDSIKMLLDRALSLSPGDSLTAKIIAHRSLQPDGAFNAVDGVAYPYRIVEGKAHLTPRNFYYSTPINGDVELPSKVTHDGKKYDVVAVDEIAFFNNPQLTKVKVPKKVANIHESAFGECPKLESENENGKKLNKPSADSTDSDKKRRLKDYVSVASLVADREHQRSSLANFRYVIEREEPVAIAIVAMQEFLKGKTQEQLDEYNADRLKTMLRYAIWRELDQRYNDWYGLTSLPSSDFNLRKKQMIDHGLDESQINFLLFCSEIRKIEPDSESGCMKEIALQGKDFVGDTLSVHRYLISDAFNPENMIEHFDDALVKSYVDNMMDALVDNKEYALGTVSKKKVNNTADKKKLATKRVVDCMKLAAKYEYDRITNLGLRYDYDELLSIGVIGAQAIMKGKTADDLNGKESTYYFAIFSEVISNEMEERYPDYATIAPRPIKYRDDKGFLILSFNAFKEMYKVRHSVKIDDSLTKDIEDIWDTIMRKITHLDPVNKAVANDFFSQELSLSEVMAKYSKQELLDMFSGLTNRAF